MPEKWTLVWSPLKKLTEENLLLATDSSGVYRLSYEANDDKVYVFYTGKSENLRERLLQHFNSQDGNACIAKMLSSATCYFRYAVVNSKAVRNGAERALYIHYKPQCNSLEPDGPDIEINFD